MNSKTLSIVSYITIIGWIIAFVLYRGKENKSRLESYHLGQSLGLVIFSFLLSIAIRILASIIPSLSSVLSLINFIPLILMIVGIINASNEAQKPLPFIGRFFEGKFNF